MTERVARVALVGPRGAGKTTIGRALATSLGWAFADADEQLAAAVGQPAGDYLRAVGEPAFRTVELQQTLPLLDADATVVALGGGGVLAPAVRAALQRPGGWTVLLIATPAVLAARIAQSPLLRPPLSALPLVAEVEAVLAARRPLYRAVANFECDTGERSIEAIVADLTASLRRRGIAP